nr:hypothetical protein [Cronobacter dublinensis]
MFIMRAGAGIFFPHSFRDNINTSVPDNVFDSGIIYYNLRPFITIRPINGIVRYIKCITLIMIAFSFLMRRIPHNTIGKLASIRPSRCRVL